MWNHKHECKSFYSEDAGILTNANLSTEGCNWLYELKPSYFR